MAVEAEIKLNIADLVSAMETIKKGFFDLSRQAGTMAGNASKAFDDLTRSAQGATQGKGPAKLGETFKMLRTEFSNLKQSGFSIPSIKGVFQNEELAKRLGTTMQGLGRSFQTASYILRGQFSSALNTGARAMALLGPEALLIAGAVTVAVGALAVFTAGVAGAIFGVKRFAEEQYRARQVGMSASEFKPIEIAFEKIGAKAEDAAPALERFFSKLSEARYGAGATAQALRQLSIASGKELKPIDLLKKGNKEAFNDVINALKAVKNEAQRMQIASTLFTGKTGPEIKAIVDTGALAEAEGMMGNLNAVTQTWGGTFSNVWSEIKSTVTAIGEGFWVMIASFATMFNMSAKVWKEWKVAEMIANIFGNLATLIGGLGTVLDPIIALFTMLLGIVVRIIEVITYLLAGVGKLIGGLMAGLYSVFGWLLKIMDFFGGTDNAKTWEKFANQTPERKAEKGAMPIEAFKPVQAGIASSLTKIGGGGESFGGGVDLYDINRQQLETQREIRDAIRAQRSSSSNPAQNNAVTSQSRVVYQ